VTKTAAALCAALFALTACGGGDGGGDDETARENIKASLLDRGADLAGTEVTDEQAGCISDGMVDEVGVEKLQDYELLDEELKIREDAEPKDMEKGDAEALAAVFVDCVDMEAMFEEQFASGAGAQLTEKQQTCLTDAIDGDVIEQALADTFQGKEADPTAELQGDIMACVTGGSGGGTSGGEDMELPDEEQ
jgi:hypothetical protein